MTLSGFAKANGVDPAKVHRARHQHTTSMPDTVDGRRPETLAKGERARFHPDQLLRWWENLSPSGPTAPQGGGSVTGG